jgi:hypothetical protein
VSFAQSAQVGRQGQLVVGVERIGGFFHDRNVVESEDGQQYARTNLNTVSAVGVGANSPSTLPRVGVDFFPLPGVSFGVGSMYYWHGGTSYQRDDNAGVETTEDRPASHSLLVQPRVGYAYRISGVWAIWPRLGGLWLYERRVDEPADTTEALNLFNLTFEAAVVMSPWDHFGFVASPYLDLGIGGTYRVETDDDRRTLQARATSVGGFVGVVAFGDLFPYRKRLR